MSDCDSSDGYGHSHDSHHMGDGGDAGTYPDDDGNFAAVVILMILIIMAIVVLVNSRLHPQKPPPSLPEGLTATCTWSERAGDGVIHRCSEKVRLSSKAYITDIVDVGITVYGMSDRMYAKLREKRNYESCVIVNPSFHVKGYKYNVCNRELFLGRNDDEKRMALYKEVKLSLLPAEISFKIYGPDKDGHYQEKIFTFKVKK